MAERLVVVTNVLLLFALPAHASYVEDTWMKANSESEGTALRGHFTTFKHPTKELHVPVYVSRPTWVHFETVEQPAVIVAHHAVGIYNHVFLRQFADDLADQGFVAVLPDFFHRVWNETVPSGLGIPTDQMNIMAALGSLKDSEIVNDLETVLHSLRLQTGVNPQGIGILGFCMGGRIAWLAAVEPKLNAQIHAAVAYHGGNVFKGLGDVPPSERISTHLRCPVLGHFGEMDKNPSPADMGKLQELAGSKLQVSVHPNADHGFSCKDSAKYVEVAASKAWDETVTFLKEKLVGEDNQRTDL